MIELNTRVTDSADVSATVTLPIDKRVKSRLRVTLDDGREAGILLPHGESLQQGDKLAAADGTVVMVQAADESLSVAVSDDMLLFARVAYHLGNRHVPVQIQIDNTNGAGRGTVSYLHDHVLDDMLRGLGVVVEHVSAPFNPEPGAYGGGHRHDHHH
jgi:urease accessory protein